MERRDKGEGFYAVKKKVIFALPVMSLGKYKQPILLCRKMSRKKIKHLFVAHVAFYGINGISISFESNEQCTAKINILNINYFNYQAMKFVTFYSQTSKLGSVNASVHSYQAPYGKTDIKS